MTTLAIICTLFVLPVFGKDIHMTCKHSFQGNYSGGDVLLKYEDNSLSNDKAYILGKIGEKKWLEICTDVNIHGKIRVRDLTASCSIYLANWMDGRRKNFVWNFKTKELYIQTLWKKFNPDTNKEDWQWSYSIGQVGSKDWKVINGWESNGIRYKRRKCK